MKKDYTDIELLKISFPYSTLILKSADDYTVIDIDFPGKKVIGWQ